MIHVVIIDMDGIAAGYGFLCDLKALQPLFSHGQHRKISAVVIYLCLSRKVMEQARIGIILVGRDRNNGQDIACFREVK